MRHRLHHHIGIHHIPLFDSPPGGCPCLHARRVARRGPVGKPLKPAAPAFGKDSGGPSLSHRRVNDYIERRECCTVYIGSRSRRRLLLSRNCSSMRVDGAEGIMNLKDAFLCIDCDEVFAIQGPPSNPQCPRCASSVMAPLSAWVGTRATLDHAPDEAARPRLEIIHATPIAA